MSYIGRQNLGGAYRQLDDISSGFDGSDTTHTMQVNSQNVTVGDVNQIILSLGGVIQKPGTDFTVSGSTLTFTTAPAANTSFFAILLGSDNGGTVTPTDGSVTTGKIVDDAVTAAKVASSGAFAIGATGTSSSLAGIPFFSDTTNGSIYTHDVSGTDSTAARNTAYGLTTLDAITTGDDNTVMGHAAGTALQDGVENVAIGTNSMAAATSGSQNTCLGHNSGAALSSGSGYNVLLGHGAGASITSGNRNIAIGVSSMDGFDTETHNLGIGISALGGSVAGGEYNVAIGNYALSSLTSADANVAVGYEAGKAITGGSDGVVAIGYQAGVALTDCSSSVFIGYQAGDGHDDEDHNIGIGRHALGGSVAGGEYNVCIGSYAGDAITSGDSNTIVGYNCGGSVTTGFENTLIGQESGTAITEGRDNVCIGEYSASNLTTGDFNVNVGNNTTTDGVDAQHQITMGYGIGSNGDNNFTFGKSGNRVYNNFSSNASWTRSSDERKKQNIKDDNLGLNFINELRPVTFQWKPSNEFPKEWDEYNEENQMDTDIVMHGLIAQEVKSALDKAGVDTFGGWTENKDGMQNISREMFVFPLINAVRELSAKVKALEEA